VVDVSIAAAPSGKARERSCCAPQAEPGGKERGKRNRIVEKEQRQASGGNSPMRGINDEADCSTEEGYGEYGRDSNGEGEIAIR
jgi:hypothetical protein